MINLLGLWDLASGPLEDVCTYVTNWPIVRERTGGFHHYYCLPPKGLLILLLFRFRLCLCGKCVFRLQILTNTVPVHPPTPT